MKNKTTKLLKGNKLARKTKVNEALRKVHQRVYIPRS